jgi:hypothetical protein
VCVCVCVGRLGNADAARALLSCEALSRRLRLGKELL